MAKVGPFANACAAGLEQMTPTEVVRELMLAEMRS
jgi:hypothetical protein